MTDDTLPPDPRLRVKPTEVLRGVVYGTYVDAGYFEAKVTYETDGVQELIPIRYDQVAARYHALIQEGAFFVWVFGLLFLERDVVNVGFFRFADEVWTEGELAAANRKAAEFAPFFEGNDAES